MGWSACGGVSVPRRHPARPGPFPHSSSSPLLSPLLHLLTGFSPSVPFLSSLSSTRLPLSHPASLLYFFFLSLSRPACGGSWPQFLCAGVLLSDFLCISLLAGFAVSPCLTDSLCLFISLSHLSVSPTAPLHMPCKEPGSTSSFLFCPGDSEEYSPRVGNCSSGG